MRLLALNPYAAGSHKAFFDAWRAHSAHDWTVVELPGWNWKWRMRTGAIDLATRVGELVARGERWDVVICTGMMNAAEWRGLAPPGVGDLPLVVYFHENQGAYPVSAQKGPDPRDVHFLLTNAISVLAADEAWFNSRHNLDTMIDALHAALAPVPEGARAGLAARIAPRARIEPPGIDDALFEVDRAQRAPGPLRILWAARWEFDKRPDVFAGAVEKLASRNIDFTLDILGGPASDGPPTPPGAAPRNGPVIPSFERLRARLSSRIRHFGRAESREDFVKILAEADVIVSTADHEFFGLAVLEAVAAGAVACVPRALAYPEVLAGVTPAYHDNTPEGVCDGLESLARRVAGHGALADPGASRAAIERFRWSVRGRALDRALERAGTGRRDT